MTFDAEKSQIPASQYAPPTGQVTPGAAEVEGTGTGTVRPDHVHAFPVAGAPAVGSRLAVESIDPTVVEWLPGPGVANLAANPPVSGTVYQNGLTVPVAITVGCAVAAGATLSAGVGPNNPPTLEPVAAVAAGGAQTTFPVTLIVPPGWYWEISGAAAINTAQAVTL